MFKIFLLDLTGEAMLEWIKNAIDGASRRRENLEGYEWVNSMAHADGVLVICSEKEMSDQKWKHQQEADLPHYVVGFINEKNIFHGKKARPFKELGRILDVIRKNKIRDCRLKDALEALKKSDSKNHELNRLLYEEKRYCHGIRCSLDIANRELQEALNAVQKEKMDARFFEQKLLQLDYDYRSMLEDLKFYERFYHSFKAKI